MQLKNLTPHSIVIKTGDKTVNLPPSGQVARVVDVVDESFNQVEFYGVTIPVVKRSAPMIVGLPEREKDTMLIVSWPVLNAARHLDTFKGRTDLVSPDTVDEGAVKDDYRRVQSVRRLQCL